MRNHDQKRRDMARSILPSSSRSGARKAKRAVHGAERARERAMLHVLRRTEHPDDVDLDLRWLDRGEIGHVVARRRESDKVAPLLRWAEAVVERDPALCAASPSDRRAYFRGVVGTGLMADHALFHLEWSVLRLETDVVGRYVHRGDRRADPIADHVRAVYEAGRHGELNRMLKAERQAAARPRTRRERREAVREGLSPWSSPPVTGRLLAGAHDIEALAAEARDDGLVRDVVAELQRRLG